MKSALQPICPWGMVLQLGLGWGGGWRDVPIKRVVLRERLDYGLHIYKLSSPPECSHYDWRLCLYCSLLYSSWQNNAWHTGDSQKIFVQWKNDGDYRYRVRNFAIPMSGMKLLDPFEMPQQCHKMILVLSFSFIQGWLGWWKWAAEQKDGDICMHIWVYAVCNLGNQ